MTVTPQQKKFYDENGYVVIPGVLRSSDFDPLRKELAKAVDVRARELHQQGKLKDLHEDAPLNRRLALIHRGLSLPVRSWNGEVFSKAIYDLLTQPKLLDIAGALLETTEVEVNGDYWVRPKLPYDPVTTLPWHQDSTYYGPESFDKKILTMWLPMLDVTPANGCLKVIPGSHKWGILPTAPGPSGLAEPLDDVTKRGKVLDVPMKEGDVLAFGNFTFHASGENSSDDVRWSVDLRYSPLGQNMDWLEKLYPGFLGRSVRNPSLVNSFEDWKRKFESR